MPVACIEDSRSKRIIFEQVTVPWVIGYFLAVIFLIICGSVLATIPEVLIAVPIIVFLLATCTACCCLPLTVSARTILLLHKRQIYQEWRLLGCLPKPRRRGAMVKFEDVKSVSVVADKSSKERVILGIQTSGSGTTRAASEEWVVTEGLRPDGSETSGLVAAFAGASDCVSQIFRPGWVTPRADIAGNTSDSARFDAWDIKFKLEELLGLLPDVADDGADSEQQDGMSQDEQVVRSAYEAAGVADLVLAAHGGAFLTAVPSTAHESTGEAISPSHAMQYSVDMNSPFVRAATENENSVDGIAPSQAQTSEEEHHMVGRPNFMMGEMSAMAAAQHGVLTPIKGIRANAGRSPSSIPAASSSQLGDSSDSSPPPPPNAPHPSQARPTRLPAISSLPGYHSH